MRASQVEYIGGRGTILNKYTPISRAAVDGIWGHLQAQPAFSNDRILK